MHDSEVQTAGPHLARFEPEADRQTTLEGDASGADSGRSAAMDTGRTRARWL